MPLTLLIYLLQAATPATHAEFIAILKLGASCNAQDAQQIWKREGPDQTLVDALFTFPRCPFMETLIDVSAEHGDLFASSARRILAHAFAVDIPRLHRDAKKHEEYKSLRAEMDDFGSDEKQFPKFRGEDEEANYLLGLRYEIIEMGVRENCNHNAHAPRQHPAVAAPTPTPVAEPSPRQSPQLCALKPRLRAFQAAMKKFGLKFANIDTPLRQNVSDDLAPKAGSMP